MRLHRLRCVELGDRFSRDKAYVDKGLTNPSCLTGWACMFVRLNDWRERNVAKFHESTNDMVINCSCR